MIFAIGCEYAPVDGWESIMPAIRAPSNYKKAEAIEGYVAKRLAELRAGKAAMDSVVGAVSKAVIVDEEGKVVYDVGSGELSGCGALSFLSEQSVAPEGETQVIFGLHLRRMLRLMAVELALAEGELPTNAKWAVDLDQRFGYNRHCIDPISVLFGSSDMDSMAVARRTDYVFKAGESADTAAGLAQFALALGGLLGLGG